MVIAELGVYRGEFSRELIEAGIFELYLVDIWQGMATSADKDGVNNTEEWNMFGTYLNLLFKYSTFQNIYLIRGRGADFLRNIPDNTLDCVYLDSDHSYPTVIEEIMLAKDKVRPGGWITGHDYVNICPGVIQAVDEFINKMGYEIEYISEDGCPSWYIKNEK